MAAKIERLAAKSVFDPPAYTQTVRVTGAQTILFISGQVDYDAKGQPGHPGDFAAQARATYSALKAQVEAGGGTLENIVKLTTFLVDIRHRTELAAIREEFFGKKAPPQPSSASLPSPCPAGSSRWKPSRSSDR